LILSTAQLAVAREYGFASWPKLKAEVERREILNSRDLARLFFEIPSTSSSNAEAMTGALRAPQIVEFADRRQQSH
ncbi:MAG: hypothetical protein ACRDKZ_10880, partial [Actinomycetota bacterium]